MDINTETDETKLSGLLRRLLTDGLITREKALEAYNQAKKLKIPLVSYLVDKKILAPMDIAIAAANDFGVPFFDLDEIDKNVIPDGIVNEKLIRQHHALPIFHRGNRLYIAFSDPTNIQALNEFQFFTGINSHPILVEEDKLNALIENTLNEQQSAALIDISDEDLENIDVGNTETELEKNIGSEDADDAPIVRFVNKLILDAINKGASDIHFEPYEKIYRVRFRVDGLLYEAASPPLNLAARIVARIKIVSLLDISERRIPQDGHFKVTLSRNRRIDFRVNTCPTVCGEKLVIRILDPDNLTLGIENLGFDEKQCADFTAAINQPQGMILVTGPTGSGKTVTLYTALSILNHPERNVSTVEDPVEIKLQGINQVNVNLKTGLTFSTTLRAFLRQDPDIIMVGEIRELETAEISVKASHTGHLVLSTLHTNSATETITRLVNMGVAPFNIATSVTLIIAQRLARKLCEHCKIIEKIPNAALLHSGFKEKDIDSLTIYGPKGCDKCTNGYSGRIGLFEVLPISPNLSQLIMTNANALELSQQAEKENMLTMRGAGLIKVANGITSLEEVNRITRIEL